MFRTAHEADLTALRDLEKAANAAALAHVFPPERYPFPDDGVLARWRIVLEDPGVSVIVAEDPVDHHLVALAAHDSTSLRHLAVHPDSWGRGLATQAIETACLGIARTGADEATLWCLAENQRARTLYSRLGWVETGESRPAQWPPHPLELLYRRPISRMP